MSNAATLNRLPQSHWTNWYAHERAYGILMDVGVDRGMSVEAAADFACEHVAEVAKFYAHPAWAKASDAFKKSNTRSFVNERFPA